MSNIREITKKPEPDESLIEMLEEMLLDAKEGRLFSILGFYYNHLGENIDFMFVEPDDEIRMLGSLDLLKDNFKIQYHTDWGEDFDE